METFALAPNLSLHQERGPIAWDKDLRLHGWLGHVGGLGLYDYASTPRDADLPRAPAIQGQFPIALLLALQPAHIHQLGESVELAAGEWTLYRPDRRANLLSPARVRVMFISAGEFAETKIDLRSLMLRRFSRTVSLNRLIFSIVNALFEEATDLDDSSGQDMARVAVHVLKKAIIDGMGARDLRDIMSLRIKDYIQWHLRDPKLSVQQIGRALNCTPRNLHRAFATQRETIALYMLRLRLERCWTELSLPACSRSVTEIGFSWGFNNAAHFSRAFKKQYGYPPSSARFHGQDRVIGDSAA